MTDALSTRIVSLRVSAWAAPPASRRQAALASVPGVVRAVVELRAAAEVEAGGVIEATDLMAAVERAGYEANPA